MRGAADACLSVLLAPPCAVCQQLLEHPSRGCVCPACWATVIRLAPPLCDRCGDPLAATRADERALCTRCRRMPRAIDRGRAAGVYEGSLRAIVHAFKYEGRRSLAPPLAALMRRQAEELLNGVDYAVPVPLHWRRERERGFNQASDLAHALGLPVLHALGRVRATRTQAELPAARRHKNVRNAFALRKPRWLVRLGPGHRGATVRQCAAPRVMLEHAALANTTAPVDARPYEAAGMAEGADRSRACADRRAPRITDVRAVLQDACVVVVDDVSTTGATLDACARVLKAAGAREVRALTAARVVTRPSR